MKKRLIAITGTAALILTMGVTAFAAYPAQSANPAQAPYGYGACGGYGGYFGLMRDQNGNFLDKNTFEANLNKAINDGSIRAEDKNYFLQMYDYCQTNGGYMGGGCGGRGRRF